MNETAVEPTVDELATMLRADPVVIDDRFGNGETAQVTAELHRIVDSAEHPTYVVLATAPPGVSGTDPAADLATQLQQRLGEDDATFAIHLGASGSETAVVGFGEAPGDDEATAAISEHGPSGGGYNGGISTVGILTRDLQAAVEGDAISGEDWESYATESPWAESTWEVGRDHPEAGGAALVTTLVAVLAAGVVLLLVQRLPLLVALHRGRTTTPGGPAPAPKAVSPRASIRDADAPAVRATLDAALDQLAQQIAADLADVEDPEVDALVTGSQDTARRLAERTGTAYGDLPDLVGALVLVRIAGQALGDARHGRDPAPYRACLIDPRHGRTKQERDLPVGTRTLAAPVCADCAQRRPEKLRPLRVAPGRFGGARPYLETDSVWARTGFGAFTDQLWSEVARDLDRRTGEGTA